MKLFLSFYKQFFKFAFFFGGGGSSSADTETNTNTFTSNTSLQGTEGISLIGNDNTVTDHNAINASMETAQRALDAMFGANKDNNLLIEHALDTNTEFFSETLAYSERATNNALSFVNNLARPDQSTNNNEVVKYTAYGVLALLAYKAIK